MISISHTQAKRLIDAQLDERKLPETQWSSLHAHLESCAECRAYRDRLTLVERKLRRGLHQRWDSVDGPVEATSPALAALYHERFVIRRMGRWMLGGAVAFLACVLLIVGWTAGMAGSPQEAAAITATAVPPTPTPSPTPTRVPSDYHGVVAYEYRQSEDAAAAGTGAEASPGEIYLLNTGAEPSNLTNSPANDHDPAWSPDGEWLAFLSNRAAQGAAGKDEVYVMHLSGSRLTQLTELSGVTWRGPISWSADGQMLALIGERTLGETRSTWVYLVPLDGSNAYPLGHSAGAERAAFSPLQPLLAFSGADAWQGALTVYDFAPGNEQFYAVNIYGSAPRLDTKDTVDRLEWSADGTRLLFRVRREYPKAASSEPKVAYNLRYVTIAQDGTVYDLYSQDINRRNANGGTFSAFSWTGVKNEFAYLDGPVEDGCQTVHFGLTNNRKIALPETHGFCALGALARENWRVKDKSVLVTGWELGRPGERGLYVVRFRGEVARAEWLTDARGMAGEPLLRPEGDRLAINPKPVRLAVDPQAPEEVTGALPELPGPETGDLLMISNVNDRTFIERVDPASGRHTLLNQSFGSNSCPRWSADGTQIAFRSDRNTPISGEGLFVMDGSGLNVRWMSPENLSRENIGCPLWSPDGRWLAATVWYAGVVIPLDEKDGPPRYLTSAGDPPIPLGWLPDGRLLLLITNISEMSTSLRAYDPLQTRPDPRMPGTELFQEQNAFTIMGVSLAPDKKSLVMSVMRMNSAAGLDAEYEFWIYTASLDATDPAAPADRLIIQSRYRLPDANAYISAIGWMPDGRAAYLLNYPNGRRDKAALFAVSEEGNEPEQIAAFADVLQSSAWSADNRWLTVLTEAGRFVLDLHTAEPEPVWVGPETGSDLDW